MNLPNPDCGICKGTGWVVVGDIRKLCSCNFPDFNRRVGGTDASDRGEKEEG